jgi:hypothetical protein
MFDKKEYMKNYMRKYWHTHPEQYKKQKKRMPKNNKTYMIKYKTILLKLIGDKCVICGSTEHLFFPQYGYDTVAYKGCSRLVCITNQYELRTMFI